MKKLFLLSVLALAFVANTFASQGGSVVAKLNDQKIVGRVSRYLAADIQQESDLNYVFKKANERYNKYIAEGMSADDAAEKALSFSLANTKVVLSKEQYNKFLILVNLTMYNSNNYNQNELLAEKQ